MGPGMEVQSFDRGGLFGTRYYFRIVDTKNWKTLTPSQPYKTRSQRDETGKRIAGAMGAPFIPERKAKP